MTNIDNFKSFVKKNPKLITFVKNGSMSWQKFYELYDLYGEDDSVWNEYVKEEKKEVKQETRNNTNSLSNIVEMAKNIDAAKLQDGITSIQKAISLFGDMLTKNNQTTSSNYTPRPVYRRFDD
ncbi:MAG: spore coat protein YlbD [Bacilli bacterium]